MSPDEPLTLAPARGLSPLATNALIGGVALIAGIGGTWALIGRDSPTIPQAITTPAPSPAPVPAPALPPGTDISTLSVREEALASKLDTIENRLRDIDGSARAASSHATQAERLMIAFAVRRAIERGLPLGPLDAQLRRRFGESHGDAVSTIIQAASQPVTLEDLRLALDTIAPRLSVDADDGVFSRIRRLFGDLVVLRQADAPSPRAADRLKRARRALDEGNVEAALGEVARMPGAGDAQSWTSAAKRYIAARNALREIEQAAMDVEPAPAAPATR